MLMPEQRGSPLTPVHGSDGWFWWWWRKWTSWTYMESTSRQPKGCWSTKLTVTEHIKVNQIEWVIYLKAILSFLWILAGPSFPIVEAVFGRLDNGQRDWKIVLNSNHVLIWGSMAYTPNLCSHQPSPSILHPATGLAGGPASSRFQIDSSDVVENTLDTATLSLPGWGQWHPSIDFSNLDWPLSPSKHSMIERIISIFLQQSLISESLPLSP